MNHPISNTPSLLLSAGILLAVLAAPAPAQAIGAAQVESRFKAADVNGDGKLTREEADAGMPRIAKMFDKIDVEKKGYLTLEQIQEAAR